MTFVLVAGRSSLDLIGTVAERRHGATEQLLEPSDVADWALAAGLVHDPFTVTPAQLDAVRTVREALHRAFETATSVPAATGTAATGTAGTRTTTGGTRLRAADIAALNGAARPAPVTPSLAWNGTLHRRGDAVAVLATVVRDGLDLLAGDQLDRVRECDRPECTRLYVDASRTRNRRWCDMAECGNRAKVAAFRRRQHGWAGRDPFLIGPPVPLAAIRGREDPRRTREAPGA